MKEGIVIVLSLLFASPMLLAGTRANTGRSTATPQPTTQTKPAATTQKASAKLRKEWKVADLKLTKEAVDDCSYPPDIRRSAIDAIDMFLSKQESLLKDADAKADGEAAARKSRTTLEAEFNKKMKVIYDNPAFKSELEKRIAALDDEMDDLSAGANKLFADLDAAGVTPQQKAKIKPLVDQAAQQLKTAKSQTGAKSAKDDAVRDDAVAKLQQARQAVKQQLTDEQKDKLKKKQVESK
jgi:hypothetical protein